MSILPQVYEYNNYPKLRVRRSWDYESPTSDKPISVDPQCIKIGVRTFDASQYSDGHSGTDSEEHAVRIPDFDVNSSGSDPFSQLPMTIPGGRGSSISRDESGGCRDDDSEDFCKVVRCIEMEDECSNLQLASNNSPKCIQEPQLNGPLSLRVKKEDFTGLAALDNGDRAKPKSPKSLNLKENNGLESVPYAFVSLSPEESLEILQEKELPRSKSFKKLIRSRSCKASLMESLSLSFNKEVKKNDSALPIEYEKKCTESPERYQRKVCSLNDAAPNTLSRRVSQKPEDSAESNRHEYQGARVSTDEGYQREICSSNDAAPNALSKSGSHKSGESSESNRLEYRGAIISTDQRNNSFEVGSDEKDDNVKFWSYENNQYAEEESSRIEISEVEENCSSCASVPETRNEIDAHQEAQPAPHPEVTFYEINSHREAQLTDPKVRFVHNLFHLLSNLSCHHYHV